MEYIYQIYMYIFNLCMCTYAYICIYIYSTFPWCHSLIRVLGAFIQSLSCVFVISWTASCEASLSFTVSWSLIKLMSLSRWCYPTISPLMPLFSSCPQSFPESRSFPMSQLFTSGGQSIGVLALVSLLPMNIQGWIPLGLTGLISLHSEGLPRIFSSTIIWKHQFFSAQPSLWSFWSFRTYLFLKLYKNAGHKIILWWSHLNFES